MGPDHTTTDFDLRAKLETLRRRRWTIVLCTVLVTGAAIGFSYTQTPRYAGVAKLLMHPRATDQIFGTDQRAIPLSVQTEIEIITTEPVVALARKKLGPGHLAVKVTQVGLTDLVSIRAESPNPQRAADVANAFATSFVDYRRKQAVDQLFAVSDEIQRKVNDLQKQIDDLNTEIGNTPVCVNPQTTALACAQRSSIEETVGVRRTALLGQQVLFRQKLDQMQVDNSVATAGAELVTEASPPTVPFEPRHRRMAVLGVLMGLTLGLGLAFVFDHLDDSVKSKEDFERTLPATPVLALIPAVADWRSKEEAKLASLADPSSSVSEAYRLLRTSVQFLSIDNNVKVVQVTSSNPQEGKTTTLANLAIAFRRAGLRVVAVDCDLRRPRLHEFFGLTNEVGFTTLLLGTAPVEQAVQPVPGLEGLWVVASGQVPPNPSELLTSPRTAALFTRLAARCDIVLVDSPPILPVADALVLSQRVDATIVVVLAGSTSRKAVARAFELLQQVNAPVVGGVLNVVRVEGEYGGDPYRYSYYTSKGTSSQASNGKKHKAREPVAEG